jgi:hypothetical protein
VGISSGNERRSSSSSKKAEVEMEDGGGGGRERGEQGGSNRFVGSRGTHQDSENPETQFFFLGVGGFQETPHGDEKRGTRPGVVVMKCGGGWGWLVALIYLLGQRLPVA